jgi:hypothetical protein
MHPRSHDPGSTLTARPTRTPGFALRLYSPSGSGCWGGGCWAGGASGSSGLGAGGAATAGSEQAFNLSTAYPTRQVSTGGGVRDVPALSAAEEDLAGAAVLTLLTSTSAITHACTGTPSGVTHWSARGATVSCLVKAGLSRTTGSSATVC